MSVRRATIQDVPPCPARALRLLALCVCALLGCTQTTNLASARRDAGGGGDGDGDSGSLDAGDGDGDSGVPPVNVSDAGQVLCADGLPCACNNGVDDDGDELIDGFDPECTSPHDDVEDTFATGERAGNPNCRDCFFDGNPSPNDDGCRIATACAFDSTSSGPGACPGCEPTVECVGKCQPRTPNGCDCFGCCEVIVDGESAPFTILLVDTCSIDDIRDEERCPRCQPSRDCLNECGECELCPGRTREDLPSECNTGSGPGFVCEGGDPCDGDQACDALEYCAQGCCVPVIL
jgi:hypothetical protein